MLLRVWSYPCSNCNVRRALCSGVRFTPRGGVLAREAPPDKAKECIAEPVASSALANDATDGGVRTLDQSLARRFGVDGRVGSQALGGGERAEAILLSL